jgi:hypothetical protein
LRSKSGRLSIDREVRDLIRQMGNANLSLLKTSSEGDPSGRMRPLVEDICPKRRKGERDSRRRLTLQAVQAPLGVSVRADQVLRSHSHQDRYTVMPADYTLMAIPLSAGKHLLRLDYAPDGYVIGRWISLGAIGAYLACVAMLWRVRRRSAVSRG